MITNAGHIHFQVTLWPTATATCICLVGVKLMTLGIVPDYGRRLAKAVWRFTDAVCQLMSPEITVSSEDLFALVALVGLVIGVSEEMGLQVGPLVEAPSADWTLVWGLLHVQDLVHSQCSRLAKSFATFTTLEWFLL